MDALISWDPSPEGNVIEYHVYHGYGPADYFPPAIVVPVPTHQYQYTGLDDYKTHYFVVTAYNSALLESDRSAEVSKRVPHRFTLK